MYAERLLKSVTGEQFARFARPGGVEIRSNHAAFVFGHLALYPKRIMQHLHLPEGVTDYPASYEAVFKNGVECQDDPGGTIYPLMTELTERYFASYRAAIEAVKAAPDAVFDEPNPVEGRLRELFPTIGMAINFYLVGHVQVHLGQVTAWRRAMGLPAA
jgi:hypothetical protein